MNPTLTEEEKRRLIPMAQTFPMRPVEGEEYPEDFIFTPREMVGRRFMLEGQEVICCYAEELPNAQLKVVYLQDFTKGFVKKPRIVGGDWQPDSVHWANMLENLGVMGRTLDKLPQVDTVFCVGSGPALMRNWRELENIDHNKSRVIGCNELLQYVPARCFDYYAALDGMSPRKWHRDIDVSRVTAVFGPIIPPHFTRAGWKDVLWYRLGTKGRLADYVSRKRPDLTQLVPFYGVGPVQLQIAWLMRPKKVVLVGHSYCFDQIDGVIYEHINEPLTRDRWEGVLREIGEYATTDITNQPVVTDYHIMITSMTTLTSCRMLIDAGVEVMNATESGLLLSNPALPAYQSRAIFPRCQRLKAAVEEANG